jgi:hypothetical protein
MAIFVCIRASAGTASNDVLANDAWTTSQECVLKKLPAQLRFAHDVDRLPDLRELRTADIESLIKSLDGEVKVSLREAFVSAWGKERILRPVNQQEFDELVGKFYDDLGRGLGNTFKLSECGNNALVERSAAGITLQWFYSVIQSSKEISWKKDSNLSFAVVLAAGALQAGHDQAYEVLTKNLR